MNTFSRGVRNAFRNITRTISIVTILGLSMGLALAMLVAHQAVGEKINSVKASVGNTITIAPAGFSGFSQVNNALTTSELAKVSSIAHVTSVSEELTDRLTTIGSAQPSGFGGQTSNANSTTSLTSPVTLNLNRGGGGGGGRFFVLGGGSSLPTNFSLPITVTGTNTPGQLNGNPITLKSGKLISGSATTDEALISNSMASKNNLKVGSTFTAYNTSLTVAGIFSSSGTNSTRAGDDTVILSLPIEQSLSGQSGVVTSATAQVDSLDNLSAATTAVKNQLGSNADITSSIEQANQAVQPLNSVKSISLYSLIGAVIAGAIIILLTMVMIVRERTREIGVIKAIGASNLRVSLQFMSEAVTLTLIGAVVGILLGVIAGNPITHLLVTNSTSTSTTTPGAGGGGFAVRAGGLGGGPRFTTGGHGAGGFLRDNFTNIHAAVGWDLLIYGLLSAIVIAVVGSAAVSYFIAKIRPAEVMRTE